MKKLIPFLSTALLLLVAVLMVQGYRNATPGEVLYRQYFQAEMPANAGNTRAVAVATLDPDASLLEQGRRHYLSEDYDLALVSLRAYLESNPFPDDYLPELMAGTSAMATGNYAEGKRYLQQLPDTHDEADAAALWYLSLIDLHEEQLGAARAKLELLSQQPLGSEYPVNEVLGELNAK
ncbi:hypothetical protein [Lewinella sp. 4G2]|uniref:hypothetical protein n=1 Tax=Lewinella sp. 4G2 TaxID=1803372 RepID=UPI0007B47F26|nr:hypothetical protein [Lewinella sp. 4G2]OAV43297.1 hypothetical protein A3850_001760 [Lewinella sp. 4G2]